MRSYPIGKRGLIAIAVAVTLGIAGLAAVAISGRPADESPPAASDRSGTTAIASGSGSAPRRARDGASRRRAHRPAARRRARARRAADYAATRAGRVAFATVGPDGVVHGRGEHDRFQSASVVKALILAAELERLAAAGEPLSPALAAELERMITVSDNDAATDVFARVGPQGVDAVARRAGMHDFRSSTTWGASRISAADLAVMFTGLRRVFPDRYEKFGLGLLGSIVPEQSWGIPEVARDRGWSVRFKGGWRPDPGGAVVNQAAELQRRGAERSIAVLTDRQPSIEYGIETVEGIAGRLLGGD